MADAKGIHPDDRIGAHGAQARAIVRALTLARRRPSRENQAPPRRARRRAIALGAE